jgi:histidine triad (HIT) family protein
LPDGMNLITSAGEAGEQSVYHLHLHVVPRWKDDGIDQIWPPKSPENGRSDQDAVARALRKILKAD